ncbi:DNLZ [Candida pseudojiufengensis]|uniref:DNLZ n=1 Tax=Candida pseudojiufengensis TaxID=497109 RepID=UPI0022253E46|nr:DNLZ [Candida pseudojiufengensis]KAI5960799.1 DNLZ [Candida pseudojiufengensis]
MFKRSSIFKSISNNAKASLTKKQLIPTTKRQVCTFSKSYVSQHSTSVFKVSTTTLNFKRLQSTSGSPNQPDPNVDQGELLIEFTCNVCDTRSKHNMSKQAYEHGTVLIQCPECKSRHLIADNLGFIRDEKFNLKDYLESEGQSIDTNVLEFNKIPEALEHSTGQTANESKPKEEKILDLEAPSDDKVVKDTKKD